MIRPSIAMSEVYEAPVIPTKRKQEKLSEEEMSAYCQ